MHIVNGSCHCGNVEFSAELSRPPDLYSPRACDCDFCRKHGAAYISDASGRLRLKLRSESAVHRYHQGSGEAECLLCATCGVLVAVLYRADQMVYGALNTRAAEESAGFGVTTSVSPKTLSPADKVQRWQRIWFPNVEVSHGDQAPGSKQ
jgi:hypothetical protein